MTAKSLGGTAEAIRAADMMRAHRHQIAQAVSTKMRVLNPRFAEVESEAQVQRVTLILESMDGLLRGKNISFLLGAAEDVMALGAMAGFGPPEFVKATHCYLPVIRRFLIDEVGVEIGLPIFDVVEEVSLPLIDRFIDIAFETDSIQTLPDVARGSTSGMKTPSPWGTDFELDFSKED